MFGLVPFHNKIAMTRDDGFQRLFDVFNEPFFNDFPMMPSLGKFKVDVKDKNFEYELTAELPGVKKDEITLNYNNGYLTISAQKNEETKKEQENYIRRERHVGSMSRSFYIDDIDESKISAEFTDGILKVNLPKAIAEIQATKQIPIK